MTDKQAKVSIPMPKRVVDFQVDTLSADNNTWIAGYYSPNRNTITSNYLRNNNDWNEYSQSESLIIHELKHRDNYADGMYKYPMNIEQTYKANMHDEISANMAELILLRQKYLETGDISVFAEKGDFFDYYTNAIKSGEIKPNSPYKEDFDKEMAFIVNKTRDAWENQNAQQYKEQNLGYAIYYADKEGTYEKFHNENYRRSLKIAYNIGGVDFTKYIDKEVAIPEIAKENLQSLELDKYSHKSLTETFNIPAYDGSMSLEQYQKVVQHKLTMDSYVQQNSNFHQNEQYVYGTATNIAQTQMLAKQGENLEYLQNELNNYKNDYQKIYESIDQNIVKAAVNSAALEWSKSGKDIPANNDKAYNDAVNKIYTFNVKIDGALSGIGNYEGNVCIRESLCNEAMFNGKIPPEAEIIKNRTGWEKTLYNYMTAVGLSPEKSDSMAKNIAPKNKLLGCLTFVCAPVESLGDKCKEFFSSENKVENKPINDVAFSPSYRQWEDKDGSRVSEVQYREILNLLDDVIQQPTKSYAGEVAKQPTNTPVMTEKQKVELREKLKNDADKYQAMTKKLETNGVPKDNTAVKAPVSIEAASIKRGTTPTKSLHQILQNIREY